MAKITKILPGTKVEKGQAVQDPNGRIGRVTDVEPMEITHRNGTSQAAVVTTEDADGRETKQVATSSSRWGVFGR